MKLPVYQKVKTHRRRKKQRKKDLLQEFLENSGAAVATALENHLVMSARCLALNLIQLVVSIPVQFGIFSVNCISLLELLKL